MINKDYFDGILMLNSKLDTSQKILRNLIFAIIIGGFLNIFASEEVWRSFFIIILMYWSFSVFHCLLYLYKMIYQTSLGKGVLLLGASLCVNLVFCVAGEIINNITSVSPTNFPHSLVFISIAMIPLVIPIGMILLFIVILISAPLWGWFFVYDEDFKKFLMPGYVPNKKRLLHKSTLLIQIFSIATYCFFIYTIAHIKLNDYVSYVNDRSQEIIYNLEMFNKSQCVNIKIGKVAFISDDHVLVATKDKEGYKFEVLKCEYKDGK